MPPGTSSACRVRRQVLEFAISDKRNIRTTQAHRARGGNMDSNVLYSMTSNGSLRAVQLISEGLYPPPKKPDPDVRSLALAILVQAFRDVVGPKRRRVDRQASAWRQDAIDWFFDNDDYPGSFDWVHDVLGPGATKLRNWVRAYLAGSQTARTEMLKQLKHFQIPH